ncbi:MAG: hypothetical protein NTV89_04635 [Proteobacteria bacterium]|nr:hypothetical protein [Pseudomonadota bacterium]
MTFRESLFRVMAALSIINPVIFFIYIIVTVEFNRSDPKEWALLLLYSGIVCGITWGIYWGIKYGMDVYEGMKRG